MKLDRIKYMPLILLSLLLTVGSVKAQEAPVPSDVPVSLDPSGSQSFAAAVVDLNDRLLVAWKDSSATASHILLQAFDRQGGRIGDTLVAGATPGTRKGAPALAVGYSGQSVVAWPEGLWPASRVYFRRFSLSGISIDSTLKPDPAIRVISGRTVSAASDSAGNTLLVWEAASGQGFDIFASRFTFSDQSGQGSIDSTVHHWIGNHRLNASTGGDQLDPVVAVDRKGNSVVAWRDLDPDSTGLRLAAYDTRGRQLFQRLVIPSDSSRVVSLSPPGLSHAYVSTSTSEFAVSWVETDTSGTRRLKLLTLSMRINQLPQTVRIDSAAHVVQSGSSLTLDRPSISANEDGDVTLLWSERPQGGASTVMFLSYSRVQGIEAARTGSLPTGTPEPFGSIAAVRPDGYFVGIWEDSSRGLPDLWMQNFSSAGLVDDPMHVSPGGGDDELVGSAALAGHPDRSFTLFWERRGVTGTRIEALGFDELDRPQGAATSLLPDTRDQRRPVSAVGTGGKYLVAWQETGEQDYRVRASLYGADGSVINEGFILDQSTSVVLGGAAVAVSPGGGSHIAWERWAPLAVAPDLVLASRDSLGNPVGTQRTLVTSGQGGGRYAAIAVENGGNQMVVWRQGTVQGVNAFIKGRVYGPDGIAVGPDFRVSADVTEFIGTSGRPVVAASPVTGRFMVVWQEFFSDRQRLYYRLYSSDGDSLEIPGGIGFRGSFDTDGTLGEVSQTSPALAVDSRGDHLVLWVEKEIGGNARLLGRKLDSLGLSRGSTFQVPGVELAALPAVSILGPDRVAMAWVDTVGARTRLLVQSLQIDFFSLSGSLALSSLGSPGETVYVHIEGNVNDSTRLDSEGNFRFRTLTAGDYRLRATRAGDELLLGRGSFSLRPGGAESVSLGRIEVLENPGPQLPRAEGPVLYQNEPNPFNPSTTITFELPDDGTVTHVSLRIYDIRGALVRALLEEDFEGGKRSVGWDGRDGKGRELSSGVYFYRLTYGDRSLVRKMILLK